MPSITPSPQETAMRTISQYIDTFDFVEVDTTFSTAGSTNARNERRATRQWKREAREARRFIRSAYNA
jgi:hypothetical protein